MHTLQLIRHRHLNTPVGKSKHRFFFLLSSGLFVVFFSVLRGFSDFLIIIFLAKILPCDKTNRRHKCDRQHDHPDRHRIPALSISLCHSILLFILVMFVL